MDELVEGIRRAVAERDPVLSNLMVTRMQYLLGQELHRVIGETSGANFHNWAVWGSKKAGYTIRQEDLDSAIWNAEWVSGIAGVIVGIAAAALILKGFFSQIDAPLVAVGAALGGVIGSRTGKEIAIYSRSKASQLILEGNRLVLEEIGQLTAGFIRAAKAGGAEWQSFFSKFREGRTQDDGQNILKKAFENYRAALDCRDERGMQLRTYRGNCYAILHEHIRLQPYIKSSLPWIIRRCVTERMMSYDVGGVVLNVSGALPQEGSAFALEEAADADFMKTVREEAGLTSAGGAEGSEAAGDWTRLQDRMRYCIALFHRWHAKANVLQMPYGKQFLEEIALAKRPDCPW